MWWRSCPTHHHLEFGRKDKIVFILSWGGDQRWWWWRWCRWSRWEFKLSTLATRGRTRSAMEISSEDISHLPHISSHYHVYSKWFHISSHYQIQCPWSFQLVLLPLSYITVSILKMEKRKEEKVIRLDCSYLIFHIIITYISSGSSGDLTRKPLISYLIIRYGTQEHFNWSSCSYLTLQCSSWTWKIERKRWWGWTAGKYSAHISSIRETRPVLASWPHIWNSLTYATCPISHSVLSVSSYVSSQTNEKGSSKGPVNFKKWLPGSLMDLIKTANKGI